MAAAARRLGVSAHHGQSKCEAYGKDSQRTWCHCLPPVLTPVAAKKLSRGSNIAFIELQKSGKSWSRLPLICPTGQQKVPIGKARRVAKPSGLQCLDNVFAQTYRIALAALGKLDHLLCHRTRFLLIAVADAQPAADIRIRLGHKANRVRFERLIAEKAVYSHADRVSQFR